MRRQRLDQGFAIGVGADKDGAAVEPALARPPPHQEKQRAPECDQREQAEYVEAAEPGAGELIARLGEKRHADGDQKHHRPGRGEPHILLFVPAESLDLIDVGHLERQHRQQRDGEDGADVMPGKSVGRHHVADIDGKTDQHDQGDLDHADEAGKHDWRIGAFIRFAGNLEGRGRKRSRLGGGALAGAPHRRHG